MEKVINALVLRAVDYRENDKILTLLSATEGKISVGAKGVKKSGAKLSFAAQPFCFAEFVIASKGERNTLVQASMIDSFYELRTDIEKLYAASAVVEICDRLLFEEDESEALLIMAVRALKDMCSGDPCLCLCTFIIGSLDLAGYMLSFDGCFVCGEKIGEKLFFDLETGGFTCSECAIGLGTRRSTYDALLCSAGYDVEESKLTSEGKRRAVKLLHAYMQKKTGEVFPALEQFLKMSI